MPHREIWGNLEQLLFDEATPDPARYRLRPFLGHGKLETLEVILDTGFQSTQLHNLPPQPTPFIGRGNEIAEIAQVLADPACRLLTLVGPGGIGKTRLVLEVAAAHLGEFANGIYFVPLQPVHSTEFLFSAIADAVKLPLSGREEPNVQLLNYLRDKEMLLVLDNIEQLLLEEGVELLIDSLQAASKIKLLVTSREVLNLQEEWLYPVHGLPFPQSAQADDIEAYSAVQLFAERARRVRREFSLLAEQGDVIWICRLVEGMPLAIELAASWLKTLRCAEIAAEIQRNLDFLMTSLRDVPERHRSMQAVFDQSWEFMTEAERDIFKRLSVFRGGVRWPAAKQVAGATLPILSALVNKCLLRLDVDGRYRIHELLRQYGEEQLQASSDEVRRINDSHCAYYADFLYQCREEVDSGRQQETAIEIEAELENVRAAWQWAVEQVRVEEIQKSSHTLMAFYQFQSRFLEAAKAFEKARHSLDTQAPSRQEALTLAEVLTNLGWFYIRLGRFEEAKEVLEQSHASYVRFSAAPPPGMGTDPLTPLATLADMQGDYAEAAKLGEQARRAHEARADKQNLSFAYHVLASATLAQGNYETARQYAQQACALAQAANNRWFMAYCLNDWGNVARALGEYTEAERHYRSSYVIREEFGDPEGMAVALNHLGEIAVLQQDYQEAQQRFQRSHTIYGDINDKGGLATSLNGLGKVACVLGQYQAARHYLHQALEIVAEIRFLSLTFSILINIGELLLQSGSQARGLEILALTRYHPASDQEAKAWAQQRLDLYEANVRSDVFTTAVRRGQNSDLESTIAALQDELAASQWSTASDEGDDALTPATDRRSLKPDQPLIEPLTPRELEVLRLIADGLSNPEIAEELIIAVGTVKAITHNIYGKLGTNNRVRAASRARELNLL